MPSSQPYQIPKVLECIVAANPASLLDIGVGFGKYGFLAREYLEVWDHTKPYSRFTRRIDGIEIFPEYLTPLHSFIYDEVFEGNATDVVPTLERSYDLVLVIDVLEHFPPDEGRKLLQTLLERNRAVLVSVPRDLGDQEDVFGNEHEAHQGIWSLKDFRALGDFVRFRDQTSLIVYFASSDDLRRLRRALVKRKAWRLTSASRGISALLRRVSHWRAAHSATDHERASTL